MLSSCAILSGYQKYACSWQDHLEDTEECVRTKMFLQGYDEPKARHACQSNFWGIKLCFPF